MPQPQGSHHRTEIRAATEIGQAAHVFERVTATTLRYSQPTGGIQRGGVARLTYDLIFTNDFETIPRGYLPGQ